MTAATGRGAGVVAETVLDAAPRLGPLYARAALGALGPRGRELPERTLVRERVTADPEQLAAYVRVCGFALDDVLPVTFPAVLVFPLQVALMADRAFPLALPGLVHVRNTITAHRRIDARERLRVAVHAERLVAHPRGATVDLVSEVGGGAWGCRSTYLARGARAPAGDPPPPEPPGVEGGEPAAVWRVDTDTGRRYAWASGDVNPIHLYSLTARAFGFPRAIAHGMWTAAHALASLQGRLSAGLTYDVVFGKPLLLPSIVELRTRPAGGGWDLDLRARPGAHHLRASVRPVTAGSAAGRGARPSPLRRDP